MAKQHALGLAGAAAAEDDRGDVVHARFLRRAARLLQQTDRGEQREQGRREASSARDTGGDVFHPDRFDAFGQLQLRLFEEGPAGDDGAQAGLAPRNSMPARPAV